uniref:Uncharacterized protein n=1 Tax=Rhizophora mucronata TaxID=61149 RepID=A0A2P2Q1M9_RHIMU
MMNKRIGVIMFIGHSFNNQTYCLFENWQEKRYCLVGILA